MKNFGLIGKSLKHSFSKKYFEEKFEKLGLEDHHYALYELNGIEGFPLLIGHERLSGLNVTIPFKESIIPFLDQLSDEAKAIGAVNTVVFDQGMLIGHNTDAIGFSKSIRPFLAMHHERALILGTGGAAKAVRYALHQLGIDSLFVSRTPQGEGQIAYSELSPEGIKHWPLIVNCTPLGTSPEGADHPNIPYEGIGNQHFCVDLVYNPEKSTFLSKAEKQGAMILNGKDMLHFQAEAAWDLWSMND